MNQNASPSSSPTQVGSVRSFRLNSAPLFQKMAPPSQTPKVSLSSSMMNSNSPLRHAAFARLQGFREAHPFRQHFEVFPSTPDAKDSDTLIIFVNGMLNTLQEARESAVEIANIFSQRVDLFFNSVENLETALSTKFQELSGRILSSLIQHLFHWKKQMKNVWIIAHNDGVFITKQALEYLHPDLRKNLSVFAFGGMTLIPGYSCGGKVVNSYNSGDWMLDVFRRPEFSNVRKRLLCSEWTEAERQHYHIYEQPGPKGLRPGPRIRKLSDLRKKMEGESEDHTFKTYLPLVKEMTGIEAFRE